MSHAAGHDPHAHGQDAHGQDAHGGDPNEHHEHVLPLKTYFKVFGALIFLTLATVGVSYLNLGPRALFVALVVAFIKASLVVGYFMHLRYDVRFHSLIFFSSLIFLAIFFGFTFLDLGSRSSVLLDQETFAFQKDAEYAKRAETPAGKAPAKDLPSVDAMPPPIDAPAARALPQMPPQMPSPGMMTPPNTVPVPGAPPGAPGMGIVPPGGTAPGAAPNLSPTGIPQTPGKAINPPAAAPGAGGPGSPRPPPDAAKPMPGAGQGSPTVGGDHK